MSKKIRARKLSTLMLIAALAVLMLASGAGVGARQKAGQAGAKAAAVNPKTSAVREATAEVLRETSELRKLPILRQVGSNALSRPEIERSLVRNLNESESPEEMQASEITLKKLGLVPSDFQLRPFIIKLLTEQVAGYYDPKTQEFYLADWIDLDGQKPVMAHELTHALQDQHFNLRRFEKWPKHDSDAELSAHSLIEGDASYLMLQYVLKSPARQLAFMKSMMTGGADSTEQLDKAPRVLRETLMFPYFQGMTWVTQVYKRGGWDEVSAAYKNLPKSTEQILHPDKYFAGEEPRKVSIRDISSSLGKGWRMADNDVEGEWGYYLLLDEFLQSSDVSRKAAEGWGGDRYALFLGPNKTDVVIAEKTVWDTEQDAHEFFDAYVGRTTKRYGVEPSEMSQSGRRFWKTKEGGVIVEQTGAGVLILEGVPDGSDSGALLKIL
jgi:Zn-dependent peptidase ImmA (M78 family)